MSARDLTPNDATWPSGFADLDPTFWKGHPRVRGELPDPARRCVAIVGSRLASPSALGFARDLAGELAAQGVVVWSGGALGIDAAAHEGALDAGGATVVVLGGGVARPSPAENLSLFERIVAAGGALVSPYPDDQVASRPGFLHRNKMLAAASNALVVVECRLISGARSAAAAARALGRPVGVVPIAPWETFGAGNRHELTQCHALPIGGAVDVARMMGLPAIATPTPPRSRPTPRVAPADGVRARRGQPDRSPTRDVAAIAPPELTDPLAREIFALLRLGPAHVDVLGAKVGRGASEVARALFELAVEGLAVDGGAGNWRLEGPSSSPRTTRA